MVNYWLCNTTMENWNVCCSNGLWGVEDLSIGKKKKYGKDQLNKTNIGDILIFNVIREGICGWFRIDSAIFESKEEIWNNALYPLRVEISPLKLLSGNGIIKFKEINGKLRNKETGVMITGNGLLGASMVPLFEEEANSEIISKVDT